LRPATGKRGAIHSITLFRLMKHDLISQAHFTTLHRERPKLQRTLGPSDLLGTPTCLPCRNLTKAGHAEACVGRSLGADGCLLPYFRNPQHGVRGRRQVDCIGRMVRRSSAPTHAPRVLAPKTEKPPRHSCAPAACRR
jgi:hypothetical protein